MSKINLTNYEAFYLDYLEGNLSETDRVAFELFLNEHPEIEMDGELPDFTLTMDEQLPSDFISQLRVFDEHETINAHTIEGFLIASAEGILSNKKQKELQAYLLKNPSHLDTLGVYHKTKLKPDLNIAYPNKQGLKKGNDRRLIFGVISAVAAVFVGVVLLFPNSETVYHHARKLPEKTDVRSKSNMEPAKPAEQQELLSGLFQVPVISTSKEVVTDVNLSYQPDVQDTLLVDAPQETLALRETNPLPSISKDEVKSEFVAFSQMKSPIEPLFQFKMKKLREKIDFRYAKATADKQGGFYLKLWNFEVSRKVSPTGDLAVN